MYMGSKWLMTLTSYSHAPACLSSVALGPAGSGGAVRPTVEGSSVSRTHSRCGGAGQTCRRRPFSVLSARSGKEEACSSSRCWLDTCCRGEIYM